MVNNWAQFILTKILRIELSVDDTQLRAGIPESKELVDENTGDLRPPLIFVCLNQVSLLESLLIFPAILPTRSQMFLFANLEFLLVPLLGWVFWKTLASEMVIRQNQNQARGAITRATHRLRHKKASMLISIEGKRSSDGQLSAYKRGPALMAIQAGATIVPLVISGTKEIWPYGDWKLKRGGSVQITFLKPIPTINMTIEDRFNLTNHLRRLAEQVLTEKHGLVKNQ